MSTLTTPRTRPSVRNLTLQSSSAGNTPTGNMGDLEVGDAVDVPGGMDGTVRFVGEVRGKKGYFVGVELSEQFASRGKNSGDAEGTRYFSTSIPGAGIFLPISRAIKKDLPSPSTGSIPPTPTTPRYLGHRAAETSPTPAMPSLSKALNMRAPSPALQLKGRPSLPRPESPLRKTTMPAPPRPPSASRMAQSRIVTGPKYAASPAAGKSVTKTPSKSALTKHTFRAPSRNGDEDGELRLLVKEKNERITQMTQEFDGHRADFRKTLDALELAGEETQRVYEAKIQELEFRNEQLSQDRSSFMGDQGDVETVAAQLRVLEEVVQELEEGLEDARRGEAEARGEVEFLRGEVERLRAELRWEREQGERAKEERERERKRSMSRSGTNGASKRGESQRSPEPVEEEAEFKTPEAARPGRAAAEVEPEVAVQPLQFKKIASPEPAQMTPLLPKPTADEDKWCALCEQDGHDIMECPNEDKL